MSVPKSLQPAFDGIEPLITDFCNQYLNDEYRELCLHLLEKLCRKRPSPLLAGRKNTWAAAIIYPRIQPAGESARRLSLLQSI